MENTEHCGCVKMHRYDKNVENMQYLVCSSKAKQSARLIVWKYSSG
jgi:hypothetical protein